MTDQQRSTEQESRTPFEAPAFAEMLKQCGCGCTGMVSQLRSQEDDCAKMMSRMMKREKGKLKV